METGQSRVDPGFVGPKAYFHFRALFEKNNSKLQIKNLVQK